MQTFLPYDDFVASAAVLDDRRLGQQRVETYQILRALTWTSYGWKNHPAVTMWRGFTPALVRYGLEVCDAWEPDDLPYAWPPSVFPRWPLRRGHPDPLPLATALALLGLDEPTEEQAAAVGALQDGRDAQASDPATGLLAGLCTPGHTLWITPDRPGMPGPEALPEPVRGRPGKVSTPIAKEPTPADLAAMAAEADADPEFRFLPAKAVTRDAAADLGLVVLDRVDGVADLGVPVLALG